MNVPADPSLEFQHFHPNVSAPRTRLPAGSWDTATHVYGPLDRYPLKPGTKRFSPPLDATLPTLCGMHDVLGIARGVLVQPTSYGFDHHALMDSLVAAAGRYVGVALINETVSDAALADLHAAGVRGARFNLVSWLVEPMPVSEVRRQADRVAELGWCTAIHVDTDVLLACGPELAKIEGPVCIDHMAHLAPTTPRYAIGLSALSRLMERPNYWLRLSNADRVSTQPLVYSDMIEHIRTVHALAPDRTVWGTDWPHVFYRKTQMVDDKDLVELITEALSDAELKRVLVDNPTRLYADTARRGADR
jgi:2-pyrone-4,6-dicarboxylate lactonase